MHTLVTILLVVTHLGLGITGGTDGIGMDLETTIGEWVGIRAGFGYMPRFSTTAQFHAQMGDGTESETVQNERFEKMSNLLQDLMGVPVSNTVNMRGTANWWNGRVLVDVYPFKKKNWFFTAGIYAGPGTAMNIENYTEDAPSLLAMQTYNNIYSKIENEEDPQPIFTYNGTTIDLDPELAAQLRKFGRIAVPVGKRADGSTYAMVPDEHGMVRAKVKVNAVRPYLGFGYRVAMTKDNMSWFRFNAGILCWGNPKMITHDGEDLTKLTEVNGQISKYVELVDKMKVFPVVNIQFSRYIF